MALTIGKILFNESFFVRCSFVRHAHKIRGKPPGVARTLNQRFEELEKKDDLYTTRIDIGFPLPKAIKRSEITARNREWVKNRKSNSSLERAARMNELIINLEDVEKDWLLEEGPKQIKDIADHYGVYQDLFKEGYFIPRVPLQVSYALEDYIYPVYYGNVLGPSETQNSPNVQFESNENSMWTLTLINPDGHLSEPNSEYIHWLIANIPGNDISKGETIVEYLQSIPPRGTGYHRYIFVLYKQNRKINFDINKVGKSSPLCDRTFCTREWYSKYQDQITPAGLAFFQSIWDQSLTDVFHSKLNMREPVFEYDFPPPYLRPQKWFPLKQPFNLYMDKYRDEKEIAKEYFLLKLKNEHPFLKPEPPLKYPHAQEMPRVASWIKRHLKKIRLGWGRVNEYK